MNLMEKKDKTIIAYGKSTGVKQIHDNITDIITFNIQNLICLKEKREARVNMLPK